MQALLMLAIGVLALAGCSTAPLRPVAAAAPQARIESAAYAEADRSDGLRSGALFDALADMDRRLFEASFARCDAAAANAIFSDDVEFYHDQTGLAVGEQVRENTRRLTASCPGRQGVTRSIVPGSLRVYPIEGYGAVQAGVHRFDERGAPTATLARFIHVWRMQDGRWRLARVLSLDHRSVPSQPSAPPG